jgi:hypothetical protein
MRSHGVPRFPDPQFKPHGATVITIGKGVDENSPQFEAAARACRKLSPGAPGAARPPGP